MKKLPLFLLAAVASLAVAPAIADDLRGDAFITAMNGNTLSGKNEAGATFNFFFLPGGAVTYQDTAGKNASGTWSLDNDGDVCVKWMQPEMSDDGCFKVRADGSKVSWTGKTGTHHGGLRGFVAPLDMGKAP